MAKNGTLTDEINIGIPEIILDHGNEEIFAYDAFNCFFDDGVVLKMAALGKEILGYEMVSCPQGNEENLTEHPASYENMCRIALNKHLNSGAYFIQPKQFFLGNFVYATRMRQTDSEDEMIRKDIAGPFFSAKEMIEAIEEFRPKIWPLGAEMSLVPSESHHKDTGSLVAVWSAVPRVDKVDTVEFARPIIFKSIRPEYTNQDLAVLVAHVDQLARCGCNRPIALDLHALIIETLAIRESIRNGDARFDPLVDIEEACTQISHFVYDLTV